MKKLAFRLTVDHLVGSLHLKISPFHLKIHIFRCAYNIVVPNQISLNFSFSYSCTFSTFFYFIDVSRSSVSFLLTFVRFHRILGPTAILQLWKQKEKQLPDNVRPLYSLSMRSAFICFTGFRIKEELVRCII